jgi:hypothetical protein
MGAVMHGRKMVRQGGKEMTTTEKNKEACRLLGICWHEFHPYCENGEHTSYCIKCLEEETEQDQNPNFTTPSGRVQLLGIMEKHEKGKLFFAQLMYGKGSKKYCSSVEAIDDDGYIDRDYILDLPDRPNFNDKLLDAVIAFFSPSFCPPKC